MAQPAIQHPIFATPMLLWLHVFFSSTSLLALLVSSLSGDRRTAPWLNIPELTIHGAMQEVHMCICMLLCILCFFSWYSNGCQCQILCASRRPTDIPGRPFLRRRHVVNNYLRAAHTYLVLAWSSALPWNHYWRICSEFGYAPLISDWE